MPWAVLAAIVLLSAAMFEPTYCAWLCPFKAVTEFAEVNSLETAVQTGIFLTLFVGLVVVVPVLTKQRTKCAFFCPFGAFQSLFNKVNVFDIRIDRGKCGGHRGPHGPVVQRGGPAADHGQGRLPGGGPSAGAAPLAAGAQGLVRAAHLEAGLRPARAGLGHDRGGQAVAVLPDCPGQ